MPCGQAMTFLCNGSMSTTSRYRHEMTSDVCRSVQNHLKIGKRPIPCILKFILFILLIYIIWWCQYPYRYMCMYMLMNHNLINAYTHTHTHIHKQTNKQTNTKKNIHVKLRTPVRFYNISCDSRHKELNLKTSNLLI